MLGLSKFVNMVNSMKEDGRRRRSGEVCGEIIACGSKHLRFRIMWMLRLSQQIVEIPILS